MKSFLHSVSASQVQSYVDCPRIWFEKSRLKNTPPPTPAMLKGIKVHKAMEAYLKAGVLPEDGEIRSQIEAAAEHFPKPGIGLIEHKFLMPTYVEGPEWVGYIDCYTFVDGVLHIYDLKTTSDFKWSKTSEELSKNIQLNSYAHWGINFFNVRQVKLSHVNLKVSGKAKANRIEVEVDINQVNTVWESTLGYVREMAKWVEDSPEKSDALPPNTNSCGLYGGCTYRQLCGFTSSLKGLRSMNMGNSDLLERLRAKLIKKDGVEGAAKIEAEIAAHLDGKYLILPPDAPGRDEIPVETQDVKPLKVKRSNNSISRSNNPISTELTICVDSLPSKHVFGSVPVMLEDFLAPICERLAKDHKIQDLGMVEYGGGKRILVDALRKIISEVPRVLLIKSSSYWAESVLEVLTPHASLIINGTR